MYYNTQDEARVLGEILKCPVYISDSGIVKVKATIIREWLANLKQLVIITTTALSPRFNYPYI